MYTEILAEIKSKIKSLEFDLKIWEDEFEGGGQLAKRELMGKIEAYRDVVEMISDLPGRWRR